MIKLVNNTISSTEIDDLCRWLQTYPQLTKGEITERFEDQWSSWLGSKYSVFVNSGSSANLAMAHVSKISGLLKNDTIIAPCLCWATTISPFMQLGFNIVLCDTDRRNLGMDPVHFEKLCEQHKPSCVILTHILGFPNDMEQILKICKAYDVLVLEDTCESVGSKFNGKHLGLFGAMSSFSTYFGHHFSTIEGGLVSTNSFELYELLKSIRSHGWSRDLSNSTKKQLQEKYSIDTFNDMYTFYHSGFNIRSTDLQAFFGISQLKSLDHKNSIRYKNLISYDSLIDNSFWKIDLAQFDFISNFAYPIIHPKKIEIASALISANIECRPLVCGNIGKQPFYSSVYGLNKYDFADIVHEYGLYVPNHPDLTHSDIEHISNIVNSITK
jgi:CDP-6-deoxy-D-xylo-4-hexulose-3-dehydrase